MPAQLRVVSDSEVSELLDHAEELLSELQMATEKTADRELRRQLRDCVTSAFVRGVHLNLSDPGSRLGGEMYFANRRAQKLGWL
jgi:hypothetical protein